MLQVTCSSLLHAARYSALRARKADDILTYDDLLTFSHSEINDILRCIDHLLQISKSSLRSFIC